MKLANNFILDSAEHLRPAFRISPFRTSDIERNSALYSLCENSCNLRSFFNNKYPSKNFHATPDGRSAIGLALESLRLGGNDVLTIVTTSNNYYISSCVTKEVEKYCKWSRVLEKNTKAVLVNHEFGYCSQDVGYYKSLGYFVIEDFAHSFYSGIARNSGEDVGDYLIYSLSKYFPVQAGGILLCPKGSFQNLHEDEVSRYSEKVVSGYIDQIDNIARTRIKNYKYYEFLFSALDLKPFFKMNENDCPGVFCFTVPDHVDAQGMKLYLNKQGIESSVFYGANAYFVPCHQSLSEKEIEYIFEVVKSYLGGIL